MRPSDCRYYSHYSLYEYFLTQRRSLKHFKRVFNDAVATICAHTTSHRARLHMWPTLARPTCSLGRHVRSPHARTAHARMAHARKARARTHAAQLLAFLVHDGGRRRRMRRREEAAAGETAPVDGSGGPGREGEVRAGGRRGQHGRAAALTTRAGSDGHGRSGSVVAVARGGGGSGSRDSAGGSAGGSGDSGSGDDGSGGSGRRRGGGDLGRSRFVGRVSSHGGASGGGTLGRGGGSGGGGSGGDGDEVEMLPADAARAEARAPQRVTCRTDGTAAQRAHTAQVHGRAWRTARRTTAAVPSSPLSSSSLWLRRRRAQRRS